MRGTAPVLLALCAVLACADARFVLQMNGTAGSPPTRRPTALRLTVTGLTSTDPNCKDAKWAGDSNVYIPGGQGRLTCAAAKKYCVGHQWATQVKKNCPVKCGTCPGGSS